MLAARGDQAAREMDALSRVRLADLRVELETYSTGGDQISTPETQTAAIRALKFKCDVLWAMLDALHHAYVAPGHVPPGAFEPEAA